MSNEWFDPGTALVAGTTALAADINDKVDAVDAAFDKLPEPHATEKGFAEAIKVGTPADDGDAATKEYVDERIETGQSYATAAATSATNAATSATAAATSASAAATSATSASGSATSAGTSATNAGNSATAAAASAVLADAAATPSTVNDGTSNRTLILADKNKYIRMTADTANTVTVPAGVFAVNDEINVRQAGDGPTTFVEGSGVTINATSLEMGGLHATATLKCVAAGTFDLMGKLAA